MVYYGAKLAALGASGATEPALVDPALAVATRDPDRAGEHLPASPSYAELPPASRLAYLTWLDDGRRDPRFHPGYALLFLSGLERRLLAERPPEPEPERRALLAEVERLRGIYRDPAFAAPSRRLLDATALLAAAADPAAAERVPLPDPASDDASLSPAAKLRLARKLAAGRPLTFDEALVLHHARHPLPAAAEGRRDRFLDAARRRFAEAFPGGLVFPVPSEGAPSLGRYEGVNRFVRLDLLRETTGERLPEPTWADTGPLGNVLEDATDETAEFSQGDTGREQVLSEPPPAVPWRGIADPTAPAPQPSPPAPVPPGTPAGADVHTSNDLGRIREEAKKVEELIKDAISNGEEEPDLPMFNEPTRMHNGRFLGLDVRYARLLDRLLARPSWPYREYDALARELGLMPDAGLDRINNWSLDEKGEPIVEEGDPLVVNRELVT